MCKHKMARLIVFGMILLYATYPEHALAVSDTTNSYDSEMIAQACKVYPEVARTLGLTEDIYDEVAWNVALERGKTEVLAARDLEYQRFAHTIWNYCARPILTTTCLCTGLFILGYKTSPVWELINPLISY